MRYRRLGDTEIKISEVGLGCWAIGGSWGQVDDRESLRALHKAVDEGVNFFDTADVYGGGRSERLLGEVTADRGEEITIATKFGRGNDHEDPQTYAEASVRAFCEASLKRLGLERIDLYQIHCPPREILEAGNVFAVLDSLRDEGKIRYYGVSVETVDEGLLCLEYPGVKSLQVIFNIFRQKPAAELFSRAAEQGVGILARVPLASGLLTGKFSKETVFEESDHRFFNRDGQAFNVGETFAGLPFEAAVELSRQLEWIAEDRGTMARAALRWILDHEAVSAVIPGFKTVEQVEDNVAAAEAPPFSSEAMARLQRFYRREVHDKIRGPY